MHVGFLYLTPAYDRVDRKYLFQACSEIGLGQKSISLIRSMCNEDSVSYEVQGTISDPLFLTKGVQQGCQSSTILWNIYLKKVIDILKESKLGIELGNIMVTALAFADEIAIVGKNAKACKAALELCEKECEKIGMTVNRSKSKVVSGSDRYRE